MAQSNSQDNGRLYFAYGSNLSTTQMRHRCPSSTPVGLAHLTGWTWIINERGYANIVANGYQTSSQTHETGGQVEVSNEVSWDQPLEIIPGTGVYGLVYRLHPDDEDMLDICEGVGYAYEREMLDVVWADVADPNASQGASSTATSASLKTGPVLPTEEIEQQPHEETTSQARSESFQTLVYVDFERIAPSSPKAEYVGRMNVGIKEASELWGLPRAYVDEVIRPYIPEPSDADQSWATN
ncbi:hypothetical protein F4859DRAFT_482038 [Xylaria cf. heliscus]|nr:hypothetical protein F4859DRAFT_482038 [Xylaria cf. heliscus]